MNNKLSVRLAVFKRMSKLLSVFCRGLVLAVLAVGVPLQAQTLNLVGNKVATYIDEHELPARQMDLVYAAFSAPNLKANWQLQITATTQAWSGSGLKSGKFSGYIDHYSLNQPKDNYVYSLPYIQLDLHAVSRYQSVENVLRLEQLYRERVGIENRFANTDRLRGERDVSWARAPSFFDNMKQLAEGRVDYLLADKAMIAEMNILLKGVGEKPVYVSSMPLFKVDLTLAMNKRFKGAEKVISDFNEAATSLKNSPEYNQLMQSDLARESLLDEKIYTDMLRKW